MILVTGSVIARLESFEALLEASQAHVHRSRGEDGCISHAVHIDSENPLRLVFFEQWRDMAALKLHFGQPGSAEFMGAVRDLGDSNEGITLYDAQPIG